MAHLHEVRDADTHFTIDAETMVITNTNAAKNKLRVGDHNSEVLTFEIPRYIENHDVLLCDKIGIHYMNAGTNKVDVSKDVYWVTDAAVSEEDENIVLFSWLVSGNATKYVGLLSFGIMFGCLEEDNTYSYVKNTEIFSGITISDGYNFTEAVVEQYSDVLEQWKKELSQLSEEMEELTKELSTVKIDNTLTESGMAADSKVTGDAIEAIKSDLGKLSEEIANKTGTGLSTEAIDKLEEVGNYLAYTTADGGSKWTELISILRNGSSGGGSGETEVTLSSISATYTGGEVTTGTALSDLTGITVIATYSDGTTKTVTGYTLSGEILEGENTITVSYGGKTTTFTVTGIVESGGGDVTAELPTDGLVDYFDFRTCEYNNVGSGGPTLIQPTQGSGQLYTWANNAVTEQSADYGIKVIRSYMYAVDKTTTLASCGTAFTWVFKSFLTGTSNPAFADDYGTLSNIMKINYCPKYNKTDNTTARLTGEALGERLVGGGYELLFLVVDGNICKLYIENKLVKEIDGTTIEDFASWYDNLILKMLGNVTTVYASQLAIYNKALSEVEITEMKAYLETLEVA